MLTTIYLPGLNHEPKDAEFRAAWRRAAALAEHFAQAAWTLSDPSPPPTPERLARMEPWERALTEQAHAELMQLSPSAEDRSEALEEVEKTTNALQGAKARPYVQQLHVLQALYSVAEPDRDFGPVSVDDALRRMADEWPGLRIDRDLFAAAEHAWRCAVAGRFGKRQRGFPQDGTWDDVWGRVATLFDSTFSSTSEPDTIRRLAQRHGLVPTKRRRRGGRADRI